MIVTENRRDLLLFFVVAKHGKGSSTGGFFSLLSMGKSEDFRNKETEMPDKNTSKRGTQKRNTTKRKTAGRKTGRTPSRATRKQNKIERDVLILTGCIMAVLLLIFAGLVLQKKARDLENEKKADLGMEMSKENGPESWMAEGAPYIDVQLLTVNDYSRPGIPIDQVNHIAIHYTANPGSPAINNRNYFESLKDTQESMVSSHFVVGLEGEVIQCIPTSEMSYATNSANVDTISIECCHPDESGQFNEETYDSAVKLTAWLCTRFGLGAEAVIRHYDVTGKNCPKYYVEHPEAWEQMKADIAAQIEIDWQLQESLS